MNRAYLRDLAFGLIFTLGFIVLGVLVSIGEGATR